MEDWHQCRISLRKRVKTHPLSVLLKQTLHSIRIRIVSVDEVIVLCCEIFITVLLEQQAGKQQVSRSVGRVTESAQEAIKKSQGDYVSKQQLTVLLASPSSQEAGWELQKDPRREALLCGRCHTSPTYYYRKLSWIVSNLATGCLWSIHHLGELMVDSSSLVLATWPTKSICTTQLTPLCCCSWIISSHEKEHK